MKLRTNEPDTTDLVRSSIRRNSTVFSKNGLFVLDSLLFMWSCTSTKYIFDVPDSMIRLCIVADSMIASSISAEMRDSTSVEAFRVCYMSKCTLFGLCISTHPCNDRHHTLSMCIDRTCRLHLSVLVLILSQPFQINVDLTVIRSSILKIYCDRIIPAFFSCQFSCYWHNPWTVCITLWDHCIMCWITCRVSATTTHNFFFHCL